jgi:alpha-tubulin suppressor-like RCC1 family protein
LGLGDTVDRATAYAATAADKKIVDAVDVAVGSSTACAVLTDTTVRCWGSDANLELGIAAGGNDQVSGVVLMRNGAGDPLSEVVKVVAGENHMCARTLHDEVYCWGDNRFDQIGSRVGDKTDIPTKVAIDTPLFTDNFQGD